MKTQDELDFPKLLTADSSIYIILIYALTGNINCHNLIILFLENIYDINYYKIKTNINYSHM